MARIDQLAAIKASLELLILENRNLHDHFGALMGKLEELEALPAQERNSKIKALEGEGAFKFNGIDIRRFQHSGARTLPPPEFLDRTRRRLDNTLALLEELMKRKHFEADAELNAEMKKLSAEKVAASSEKAVRQFRDQVEELRNSPAFLTYLDTRKSFLAADPTFRAEAEFLNAKEAVADGEQSVRARGVELESLKAGLDSGKMSPDDVNAALEEMTTPDAPKP
jgi:glutathione S-transferase